MPDFLLTWSDNPAWLLLVVVISTFMLEDLAIIGTALLAAVGKLDPVVAFVAVCLGMFIGDSALYLLGRSAHFWRWLSEKCQQPLIACHIRPLKQAPLHQLVLIRCMPGLRTFGYIACGVAKVPGWSFALANLISILLWAGLLYGAALWFGQRFAEEMSTLLWYLLPLALVLFIFGQRRAKRVSV